jgi:protein-L-isoaspartate O-methyltransferase
MRGKVRVLEIGCGTGKNTSVLAQIGEKVLALDFSENMIEKANHFASAFGGEDNGVIAVSLPITSADRSGESS